MLLQLPKRHLIPPRMTQECYWLGELVKGMARIYGLVRKAVLLRVGNNEDNRVVK